MATYPSMLRKPLVRGYSRNTKEGFFQSPLGQGSIRNQVQTKDTPSLITVEFAHHSGFKRLFWQWWKEELDYGMKPFDIALKTESGLITQTVRFTPQGQPQLRRKEGDVFFYSATLQVRKLAQV